MAGGNIEWDISKLKSTYFSNLLGSAAPQMFFVPHDYTQTSLDKKQSGELITPIILSANRKYWEPNEY